MTQAAVADLCARCSVPMDRAQATYDSQGNLVCRRCAAQSTVAAGEGRASQSIVAWAFGVLGSSLLAIFATLFVPPFLVLFVHGLVAWSGVAWFTTIRRFPKHRDRLGRKYGWCAALVVLGMVIAGVRSLAILAYYLGINHLR